MEHVESTDSIDELLYPPFERSDEEVQWTDRLSHLGQRILSVLKECFEVAKDFWHQTNPYFSFWCHRDVSLSSNLDEKDLDLAKKVTQTPPSPTPEVRSDQLQRSFFHPTSTFDLEELKKHVKAKKYTPFSDHSLESLRCTFREVTIELIEVLWHRFTLAKWLTLSIQKTALEIEELRSQYSEEELTLLLQEGSHRDAKKIKELEISLAEAQDSQKQLFEFLGEKMQELLEAAILPRYRGVNRPITQDLKSEELPLQQRVMRVQHWLMRQLNVPPQEKSRAQKLLLQNLSVFGLDPSLSKRLIELLSSYGSVPIEETEKGLLLIHISPSESIDISQILHHFELCRTNEMVDPILTHLLHDVTPDQSLQLQETAYSVLVNQLEAQKYEENQLGTYIRLVWGWLQRGLKDRKGKYLRGLEDHYFDMTQKAPDKDLLYLSYNALTQQLLNHQFHRILNDHTQKIFVRFNDVVKNAIEQQGVRITDHLTVQGLLCLREMHFPNMIDRLMETVHGILHDSFSSKGDGDLFLEKYERHQWGIAGEFKEGVTDQWILAHIITPFREALIRTPSKSGDPDDLMAIAEMIHPPKEIAELWGHAKAYVSGALDIEEFRDKLGVTGAPLSSTSASFASALKGLLGSAKRAFLIGMIDFLLNQIVTPQIQALTKAEYWWDLLGSTILPAINHVLFQVYALEALKAHPKRVSALIADFLNHGVPLEEFDQNSLGELDEEQYRIFFSALETILRDALKSQSTVKETRNHLLTMLGSGLTNQKPLAPTGSQKGGYLKKVYHNKRETARILDPTLENFVIETSLLAIQSALKEVEKGKSLPQKWSAKEVERLLHHPSPSSGQVNSKLLAPYSALMRSIVIDLGQFPTWIINKAEPNISEAFFGAIQGLRSNHKMTADILNGALRGAFLPDEHTSKSSPYEEQHPLAKLFKGEDPSKKGPKFAQKKREEVVDRLNEQVDIMASIMYDLLSLIIPSTLKGFYIPGWLSSHVMTFSHLLGSDQTHIRKTIQKTIQTLLPMEPSSKVPEILIANVMRTIMNHFVEGSLRLKEKESKNSSQRPQLGLGVGMKV